MEEAAGQHGQDRKSSASYSSLPSNGGDGPLPDNRIDKPRSPKAERIVSPNPSAVAATVMRSASNASRARTPVNSSSPYTAMEQTYVYGGYDDGLVNWGDGSNYVRPNNLQIMSPAIYNDNASVLFHPGYTFDTYGQFSPIASPVSPIMIDGQLYSPHQVPVSPSYYSQPVPITDLATPTSSSQEGLVDVFLSPGSGYYLHYPGSNSLGFYNIPGDIDPGESVSSQSTLVGILGPYEHSFGQVRQQQTPYHGYESLLSSSAKRYEGNRSNHHGVYIEGKHRGNPDAVNLTIESHASTSDRNRGPRASKPKGSGSAEHTSSDLYNRPDFVTTHENAKFFVIKSFSEDNIHRSIKYGVWASTPLGNRKLDAAYQEAKEAAGSCRIFLFFSVNASGQFCGVAEMISPVDFENDADHWQQDRWSGQFRVQWHIIKDVPNSRFRHILLENNDNKPVTHSRDSQEVNLQEGIAMLKIFKEHDSGTSILDDFNFYDEREKSFQEKRAKEQASSAKNSIDDASIDHLSDQVADSLRLNKHQVQ